MGSCHHPSCSSGEPLSWDDMLCECASGVGDACVVNNVLVV